jgi:hypothetical protein
MFWMKDGVQWVGFGGGTVAVSHSEVYPEQNGPQIEVQLRDPGESHPLSGRALDCPKEDMMTYPCKVVLGFNRLESLDALVACLEEARAELVAAIGRASI